MLQTTTRAGYWTPVQEVGVVKISWIFARAACFVKSPCLERRENVPADRPADHELLGQKMVDLGPPIFLQNLLIQMDI